MILPYATQTHPAASSHRIIDVTGVQSFARTPAGRRHEAIAMTWQALMTHRYDARADGQRDVEENVIMQVQHARLSRQELYDLVWSEPVSKVAARYSLSDVGLKKICLKHRIPVPPRGYWQKIALPAVKDADEIVIRVVSPAIIEGAAASEIDPEIEAEDNSPPVIVSELLHRPHGATVALREALRREPDSQARCIVSCPGRSPAG